MKLSTLTTVLLLGSLSIGGYALLSGKNGTKVTHPVTDRDIAATAAMITNLQGNSGGTGVILSSNEMESSILTNSHVCEVVKNGGTIRTGQKNALVSSYKRSRTHDLCLITVNTNLGINTEISKNAPNPFDVSVVSGFPQLLPNIITRGHFSMKEVITVMTGIRKCEQADIDAGLGVICAFLGGIPEIHTYQAQVTSSTIQPGSSGSSVFSGDGKISGIIFAGNGNLSYGHMVPLENVRFFVEKELSTIEDTFPGYTQDVQLEESAKKLRKVCKNENDENYSIVQQFCDYIKIDLVLYNDNLQSN